jgi:hypothetical protein
LALAHRLRTFYALAFLLAPLPAVAAGPIPPCARLPVPLYPALGQPPAIAIFHRGDLTDWPPDACAHFRAVQPALLVALAGRFTGPVDRDGVLARFGAISQQRGIRYWSVTDRRWQALVIDAEALSGPGLAQRRADFTVAELTAGQDLYFAQQDNRSSAPVIYRLRVRDVTPRGFLVETENVTPVRYLVMQVYGVGDLHMLDYLERAEDGAWNYYAINEIDSKSRFFAASDKSYVNRAAALFRFFAGIPTDREPPAAR